MPLLLGIDLGTTKLTAVVFDPETGETVQRAAVDNDARSTTAADAARGRSEWSAERIVKQGCACLREVTLALGSRRTQIAALGITGQQHGMLLVDQNLSPVTPFINWQDRRGTESRRMGGPTWVEAARELMGEEGARRCGCRLQSGFMATTLFWLKENGGIPRGARACFIMDLFASRLSGGELVSEPTAAGSSGVFSPTTRQWDVDAIAALGLELDVFPEVREAGTRLGALPPGVANAVGLPAGLAVHPALGDHQASYLGSVGDRSTDVLVNVGTGAQVAVFSPGVLFQPPMELRPFPFAGNLLSNVGLPGGWSYQLLEQFFASAIADLTGTPPGDKLYGVLNRLAEQIPAGAEGLKCQPTFSGTRSDATIRGSFAGISPQNFTAAHFARALLEGMANGLFAGLATIREQAPHFQPRRLVAAGNGLRENSLLSRLVATAFGLPLVTTIHREEAAVGAALAAGVAAGVFADPEQAGECLRYLPQGAEQANCNPAG